MKKHTILGLGLTMAALAIPALWSTSGCSPVTRTFGPGSGGSGGGGECKEGETQSCYDGPSGTEKVGECHVGTQKCGADGKFGSCEGEQTPVTPDPSICSMHKDQNCDGVPHRCPLDLLWGAAYGVAGGAGLSPPSMGIGPDGSIVISTFSNGQLDFGKGAMASAGGDFDVFVAKLDPTGKAIWSQQFGDSKNDQFVYGTGVDGQGNIFLAGSYYGSLDKLNAGFPPSNGSSDAWVVKLAPGGTPLWGRSGGDSDTQEIQALAVSPSGDVIVAGRMRGSFAFSGGGQLLTTNNPSNDTVFVQRFGGDGTPKWGVVFDGPNPDAGTYGYQNVSSMAVDSNDNIVITGDFQGSMSFPGSTTLNAAGGQDVWVTKLQGSDGSVLWARSFGGMGDDSGQGVTVDSQLSIILSGSFTDTFSADGQTATTMNGNPEGLYMAKLTPGGMVTWLKSYGSSTQINGMFVSADANNDIVGVGAFDGSVDFGQGLFNPGFTPGMYSAAFLVKFDTNGNELHQRFFTPILPDGGPPPQFGFLATYRVGFTPMTNEIVTAGFTILQTDLGGGPIGQNNVGSPFLGKFAP